MCAPLVESFNKISKAYITNGQWILKTPSLRIIMSLTMTPFDLVISNQTYEIEATNKFIREYLSYSIISVLLLRNSEQLFRFQFVYVNLIMI